MKFVCDNCQTQYMISDDKVGQKNVKVRCKRCGNMITLRSNSCRSEIIATNSSATARVSQNPDAAAVPDSDELGEAFDQLMKEGLDSRQADDTEERQTEIVNINELDQLRAQSGLPIPEREHEKIDQVFANIGDSSAPPTEKPEAGEDWYAAIDNKQVGPLSIAELKEKVKDRLIDANSLVWRQGMEDWQSLQELPHLQQLLGGLNVQSTEQASPESNTFTAAQENPKPSGFSDFSLTALVEKELASVTGIPPANQEIPKKSERVLSTLVSDEVPPWERDETASEPVAEKRETIFQTPQTGFNQVIVKPKYLGGSRNSTRKIILGSVIAAALVLVTSIIVYQLRTRSQPDTTGSKVAAIERPRGFMGNENSSKAANSVPTPPAGGAVTTVSGTENTKVTISEGNKEQPLANEAFKNNQKEIGKASLEAPATKKEPVNKPTETTVEKSTVKVSEIKEDNGAGSYKDNPKKPGERIATAPVRPTPPGRAKEPSKTLKSPSENTEDNANLPKTLTNEQIKGVIRGKIEQMKNCVEQQQQRDPSVTGTMIVSFIIENTGRVNTINTLSEEHRGSFVATCIAYVIKSMKFPRFTGEPVEVPRLPLKLGG